MPPVSLLIKPASSNCNLSCKYCFYHAIAENRNTENYGLMSMELLELIVKKALEYADHVSTFAFQGGEPTLIGLEFYKKLIEFQRKYNTKKVKINNAIQTNGLAIDDDWAKFLADNNFLVGISLDGPKDIHDANRIDTAKGGSYNRVIKAIELFDKYKVEYNILFVVNGYVSRHIDKIYSFFKKRHFKYLQFIPCLDPMNGPPGGYDYSLKPERFASFLKSLFDLWYGDIINGNNVSIRYFDNLVGIFLGYKTETCGMSGECQCQFVIEADGGVFPCDFYVFDQWLLGNIMDKSLDELRNSDAGRKFIAMSRPVDPKCAACKWFFLCRGGCRRNREPFTEDIPALNFFCESYKTFFDYSADRISQVAAMLRNSMP